MEMYNYRLFNKYRQIDCTQAQTLDEAMRTMGIGHYKIAFRFPSMAVLSPPSERFQMTLAVQWESSGLNKSTK